LPFHQPQNTAVEKKYDCSQPSRIYAHSDPLLVSTLDGALHAVSPETGNVLWSVKDDPVLKMPEEKSQQHNVNMLPNPKDGSLYVVNKVPGASESIRKLPFTIPELVSASPTRSSDGILYMGKKVDRLGRSLSLPSLDSSTDRIKL
jgi:serine/threonine-protein kinase/endoribonuclease IRE1